MTRTAPTQRRSPARSADAARASAAPKWLTILTVAALLQGWAGAARAEPVDRPAARAPLLQSAIPGLDLRPAAAEIKVRVVGLIANVETTLRFAPVAGAPSEMLLAVDLPGGAMFAFAAARSGPNELPITVQRGATELAAPERVTLSLSELADGRPFGVVVGYSVATDLDGLRNRLALPLRQIAAGAPPGATRVTVELDAGLPIAGLASATHRLRVVPDGEDALFIRPLHDAAPSSAERFELEWTVDTGPTARAVLFVERREDGAHALLGLLPPSQQAGRSGTVLRGIEIRWPAGVEALTFPQPRPDLTAGRPLRLVARLSRPLAPGETVTVTGDANGRLWRAVLEPQAAAPGIAHLWELERAAETARPQGSLPAAAVQLASLGQNALPLPPLARPPQRTAAEPARPNPKLLLIAMISALALAGGLIALAIRGRR